jgi:hypothetical protein
MSDFNEDTRAAFNSTCLAEEVTEDMVVWAAIDGNLETLRKWGRQGVRVTTGRPLRRTAENQESFLVKVAVCLVEELGADVNEPDYTLNSSPPLLTAACEGNVDMVRYLVKLGADVNKSDEYGTTALVAAASGERLDIVEFLVELGTSADNNCNAALQSSACVGNYLTVYRKFPLRPSYVPGVRRGSNRHSPRAASSVFKLRFDELESQALQHCILSVCRCFRSSCAKILYRHACF